MKIGIMGAHGTGKTTFAIHMMGDLLRVHLGETIGLLSEVARICPFSVNEDTSREAQAWIFHKQMITEIEMFSRNENLICDRTVIDSLAYSMRAGFQDQVDIYLDMALDWMDTYDVIYWARPDGRAVADDGFRSQDLNFQREIDVIFEQWVKVFGISCFNLLTGEENEVIETFPGPLERAC